MAELIPSQFGQAGDDSDKRGGRKPKRPKAANIAQWVEGFNAYIGAIAYYQPERVQDLLAYSSLIVHASRKYKGDSWVQYDANFRKRAAAHPGERWAEVQTSLWTLAFANTEHNEHCSICFSIDHVSKDCGEYETPAEEVKPKARSPQMSASSRPICVAWNKYRCQSATCTFQHICLECRQCHKLKDCRRYNPYKNERPQPWGFPPR